MPHVRFFNILKCCPEIQHDMELKTPFSPLFRNKFEYFFQLEFANKRKAPIFATAIEKNTNDSVAQLVEHIPFKDGVLGSNPS